MSYAEAEAVIDEVLLSRAVAAAHAAHLRHRDVALVDEGDEVFREVVEKRVRRRAGLAPREHAGVVLDPRAVADLAEHFEVVSRPLLDPLSLDQLVLRFEVFNPLLHLPFDLLVCALAHIRGHDVVIRGIYGGVGEILHDRAGDGIYLGHAVDLVAEEFKPQRAVV